MSHLFQKGDAVLIFDPRTPDAEPERATVAQVYSTGEVFGHTKLRLKGNNTPFWYADGSKRGAYHCENPPRLIRPQDLPAAREKARKALAVADRKRKQGQALQDLATQLRQAATAIEHADGTAGGVVVAVGLGQMLEEWIRLRCLCCSACSDTNREPLCDGSGVRSEP